MAKTTVEIERARIFESREGFGDAYAGRREA
jgi:hypothetical protein